MSDNSKVARQILGELNHTAVPQVKINAQRVQQFIDIVRKILHSPEPSRGAYTVNFVHCGSAYEGLTIEVDTDFDIAIQLAEPFESDNFIVERDPSGFFKLRWKSHLPAADRKSADDNGYVDAANLRGIIFSALQSAIEQVRIENAVIKCKEGLAALAVTINYNTGHVISMDWVPQIVFRTWGQCPDLIPLHELPKCLRSYIDTLNKNKSPMMFFALAAPGPQEHTNQDKLLNVAFSLFEKEFVHSNIELRDMVRLVKLVAKIQEWKQLFGFQSFFAKRIAVKRCEELKELDLWEGYKAILQHLSEQVGTCVLDGYFIKNQIAYRWEPEKAKHFQEAISNTLKMDPKSIKIMMGMQDLRI